MARQSNISDEDWSTVKARRMIGETSSVIAKDYPISRQTIDQRADREGWLEAMPKKEWLAAISKRAIDVFQECNAESRDIILELVEFGMSPTAAGEYVGVAGGSLSQWRKKDVYFNNLLISAARRFHINNLAGISESKDWHAKKWLLETRFKEEYADSSTQTSNTIKLELSFTRGTLDFDQPPIIDVEATDISAPPSPLNDVNDSNSEILILESEDTPPPNNPK